MTALAPATFTPVGILARLIVAQALRRRTARNEAAT